MGRIARAGIAGTVLIFSISPLLPAQAAEGKPQVNDFEALVESSQGSPLNRDVTATAAQTSPLNAAVGIEECVAVGGDEDLWVWRYAGPNRYETAACVSLYNWADHDDPNADEDFKAEAVVLARGDKFPDALAGGPLAAHTHGPLLLTRPSELHPATEEEIKRVLAPGGLVYLLGGDSSISEGTQLKLEQAGYQTKRLAGPNRYETAITVAKELPATSNFFFATGRNFPDALGAGTAAAWLTIVAKYGDPGFRPFPLLLTADETVPTSVANFVRERAIDFEEWTLVAAGGWAERALIDEFGSEAIAASFAGSNRYETATEIADFIFTDENGTLFSGNGVGLATGLNFPDALAATPMLAGYAQPLLLTNPTTLNDATADFLTDHSGEGAFLDVFGGESTVSQPVVDAAEAAFR